MADPPSPAPRPRRDPITEAHASDATLVARTRAGDAEGFDALVRRHLRAAQGVAFAILGDRHAAEDVCQDAFLVALERIDECRQPDRFGPWVSEIVRNRAHNRREYEAVRATHPLDDARVVVASAREPSPVQAAERSELRAALSAALATLRDVQREVVLLHDLDGLSHRAIAAALGMSEVMSRQHLFVARRALRRLLQHLREPAGSRSDLEPSHD